MLCSDPFVLLCVYMDDKMFFFSWPGFLNCDTADILDYNLLA